MGNRRESRVALLDYIDGVVKTLLIGSLLDDITVECYDAVCIEGNKIKCLHLRWFGELSTEETEIGKVEIHYTSKIKDRDDKLESLGI